MGYQESFFYVKPQKNFDKLIRAYEKAESSGYYDSAGAKPYSVIVLKQAIGEFPAGTKLLWVCGERSFQTATGIFGGRLRITGQIDVIPVEELFSSPKDYRLTGIDLDAYQTTENSFIKRYRVDHYAYRAGHNRER